MATKSSLNALVTGAAGFIGFHLCLRLKESGYEVWGVDDLCTGLEQNAVDLQKAGIHFLKSDISTSWTPWTARINGNFEFVFHFASPASPPLYQKMPLKTMAANSLGLYRALDFATSRNARLIFASTSEIYGSPEVSPQPETYWGNTNCYGPRACYDESKRFGEALIYSYNQEKKTSHGLIRIFNTYGPRMNPDDGRVVINFLVQMLRGEDLTIHGDGSQTRSFCYVDDLVEGILAYAKRKELTQPINLGSESEITVLQLAQAVQKLASPKLLGLSHIDRAMDDPPRRRPDLKLARKFLGWEPKISLGEGLKRVLDSLA